MTTTHKRNRLTTVKLPPGLVSVKEWAEKNGYSVACCLHWVARGKLEGFRVPGYGRRAFVRETDIERFAKPTRIDAR